MVGAIAKKRPLNAETKGANAKNEVPRKKSKGPVVQNGKAAPNKAAPNKAAPNKPAPNKPAPNKAAPNKAVTNKVAPNKAKPQEKAQKLQKKTAPISAKTAEKSETNVQASKPKGQRARAIEKRKQKRKELGQFKPHLINLSEEQIKARIEEITSRKVLTKTARRKLAVLRKKLSIKDGTIQDVIEQKQALKELKKASKAKKLQAKQLLKGKATAKSQNADVKVGATKGSKPAAQKGAGKAQMLQNQKVSLVLKKEESEESDDDEEETQGSPGNILRTLKNMKIETDVDIKDESDDDEDDEVTDEDEDDEDEDDDDDDEEMQSPTEPQSPKKAQPPKKTQSPARQIKSEPGNEKGDEKKKRFVLFVGNLPYEIKPEEVEKHFLTKVSSVSSVRIPTKPGTQSSRGFCYVEVDNQVDYEKGLSLHDTFINGRKIKVQYTSPGSKNIKNKPEMIAKNKKLDAMRKAGKLAGGPKNSQKRRERRMKQN